MNTQLRVDDNWCTNNHRSGINVQKYVTVVVWHNMQELKS